MKAIDLVGEGHSFECNLPNAYDPCVCTCRLSARQEAARRLDARMAKLTRLGRMAGSLRDAVSELVRRREEVGAGTGAQRALLAALREVHAEDADNG